MKTLLNQVQLDITLQRLAHQLIEDHFDFQNTVIIGLQPRGIFFSDKIIGLLSQLNKDISVPYGHLDITFYRDDLDKKQSLLVPSETNIVFSIDNKKVILIDDVLHTGRTIRAAMDALLDFGRPREVLLMTLIDRRFSRELPIQADYVGLSVDTLFEQKVRVLWEANGEKQNEVVLL